MLKKSAKKIVVAIITLEAKWVLRKYAPKIIAVTGNVGKTSTKDALFTVLSHKEHVRKSDKSFNSEVGVPLTILGCKNAWLDPLAWLSNIFEGLLLIILPSHYPKWLILEVGADRPGDISSIAKWLKPDIVVLTRLPELPVHVEFFSGAEEVRDEKLSIIAHIKEGGALIANGDDHYIVEALKSLPPTIRQMTYGLKKGSDITAEHGAIAYEKGRAIGMRATVHQGEDTATLMLGGALGKQHLYAALGGIAGGLLAEIPLAEAVDALAKHSPPPGRMRILEGRGGFLIIDDTYNSSPAALDEALSALQSVRGDRKIAVLGDMLELGEYSIEAHKRAGERAASACDILVSVGVRASGMVESARAAGMPEVMTHPLDNAKAAATLLEPLAREGDVILIKGSQSIRLERLVAALMAHPEKKGEYLVRQEAEWLARI